MKIVIPDTYPTGNCILIPVDVAIAPLIAGMLRQFTEKHIWEANSYETGYNAIQEIIAAMSTNCIGDLVTELRALRGIKPEYASTPVEEQTTDMFNSFNDLLAANLAARGILDDGWFTDTYATYADIVQAQRGTDKTNTVGLWDTVSGLLSGAASVGTIVGEIANVLSAQEETIVEGGLLTALIAITAANSALLQQLSILQSNSYTTLNSILGALRGETPPEDNILQALRGDTPASSERNVVEQLI